jgi:hypothetical protein
MENAKSASARTYFRSEEIKELPAVRSLLCASKFPDRPQIFPALAAREFCSQTIESPPESRDVSVILSQSSANFPVISPGTGNQEAETGSLMTASSAPVCYRASDFGRFWNIPHSIPHNQTWRAGTGAALAKVAWEKKPSPECFRPSAARCRARPCPPEFRLTYNVCSQSETFRSARED